MGIEEFVKDTRIAYFSMEIGIRPEMHTYSGGLGILAGDTLKSAADLRIPMIGVTLIHRMGYFRQELDPFGRQIEHPDPWDIEKYLKRINIKVSVEIERKPVYITAWYYVIESTTGGKVPVIFLDTEIPENDPVNRTLTHYLYGGDLEYRLKQEIILGIGGVRVLDELGFEIRKYHMNEGHSSLLTLELLNKFKKPIEEVWSEELVWDVQKVRDLCVFTTHTPVEAGHDRFPYDLVQRILGEPVPMWLIKKLAGDGMLNMTLLGFNLSEYINGVSKKHEEVSERMFPGYEIHAITNGVHPYTWVSESFKNLYNKHLPGWAMEPEIFVRAWKIPEEELWDAHMQAKKSLIDYVNRLTGMNFNYETFTIGFARRATPYKRADLLLSDPERLAIIGEGRVQIIYAGKAHPKDEGGKQLIQRIFQIKERIKDKVKIVYLPNYDMAMAMKLVAGVDIWLNNPLKPLEASGTSGMKATHNGVPNFSVLDGWWIEGWIEGYTGWAIGTLEETSDPKRDAEDLYFKLGNDVLPMFYENRNIWIKVMKNAIAMNAYYFNTHRMIRFYVTEAYIR
ncbi:Glycogen phosphorylase [Thermodesulfovibrio sp. N1]|uniref:alpha-glucan family phosphorylase n=1 Tax=unclassified Thermodesulfovibrio TaxID=2645936 RepID=UPI00083AEB84|nr:MULTISPECIES: alpha-glucan family phosphorylase [unclassified Thermodesulfovibrio]MDI1472204.1 alpha-glucan family phosphorylase [Thermodesulfovibrio sp. 1176]ODA43858.1 Glycogen phosphorylase [Thermodesulfovibrio sp. N1]